MRVIAPVASAAAITGNDSITTPLAPGAPCGAVAVVGTNATSVRVVVRSGGGVTYDRTTATGGRSVVTFEDLAAPIDAQIEVTLAGATVVATAILAGNVVAIGETEGTPTVSLTDYSRRVTDDFGVTTVVQRGFAKRNAVRVRIDTDALDALTLNMAALRALPALWIAGDDLDSLMIYGLYKDFSVDVAQPPVSFATLTVEGLAASEPYFDNGADVAAAGASTLQLLQPLELLDPMLAASNVAEDDYPEWSAALSYGLGARVIKAATHRIYESAAAANAGNDPATSALWSDVGATNRWAMFDQALGSATTKAGQIVVQVAPVTAINAVALLDVVAATVRVQADGYDRTVEVIGSVADFLDMPTALSAVTVTVTGPGDVSIGTMLIGSMVGLGVTASAPSAGIIDYSLKTTDDFGVVTIVPRAWAKNMSVHSLVSTDATDRVVGRIAAVRAIPSLWIASDDLDTLTIYGFFKDFSLAIGEGVSTLALTIEGLSAAAKLAPLSTAATVDWPDVTDSAGTKPADNADVTSTAWQAATGSTPAQTGTTIAQLLITTSDLTSTYGDTASAAASAQAAAASRDASQAALVNSQTAASQAQDSYTAADGARADAVAAEQSAAASAGTASSSSAIAASSASAATLAMAQTFPSAFTNLDAFTRDYTTAPESATSIALTGCYIDPSVNGYATLVLQQPSTISTKGWMTMQAGHTYRTTLHYGVFGGADTANGALGYLAYASDGTYLGPFAYVPLDNANGGFKPLATIDTTTEAAQAAFPSAYYLRPYVQTDMPAGSGSLVGLNTLSFRDVVDLIAAQDAARASAASASTATASENGATQQAVAAMAAATNSQTFAGQSQSFSEQASSSSSSAAGSANSAALSAGVSAAAGTAAQGVADSLYPTITPGSIASFIGFPTDSSVAGPSSGWPAPYLLTNNTGGIMDLRHKLNHPMIVGRRYRVTLWVFTYSEFTRVYLYAAQANVIDGNAGFEKGSGGNQVDGWNWGDKSTVQTQTFLPFGIDYSPQAGDDPFFSLILHVDPQYTGTPANLTYHVAGFNFSDVTDVYAALGSAAAASSSAQSAAASNDASGQHASAAQQSATDAATQYGNSAQQAQNSQYYAGQSATSASQASASESNSAGSANTASSFAQQAAAAQNASGQSAGASASSASVAHGAADSASASSASASSSANDAYNYSQNSQSAANSSSSSSATASAAAAAAQQSATLSASLGLGTINPNSNFDVWSDPAGLPDGVSVWADQTAVRQGGVGGHPYAVDQTTANGEQTGFSFNNIRKQRGWYVLEANIRAYGSLVGAGVGLFTAGEALTLRFDTDPDMAGTVRTATENAGWSYTWRKLVQATQEDYGATLYAFTAYSGYGDVSTGRRIIWDRVGLVPATDGEVAGGKALPQAAMALAQISSLSSVVATNQNALAQTVQSLQAQINQNTGNITTNAQTAANEYSSAAQQITTLTSFATANPNLIGDVDTWSKNQVGYSTGGTWGPTLTGTPGYTGLAELARTPRAYVDPGATYVFSADLLSLNASSGAWTGLDILAYDASNNLVGQASASIAQNVNFADGRPRNQWQASIATPGNTAYVVGRLLAYSGSSSSGSMGIVGIRRGKLERGNTPTAYTVEGQTSSLSASVSVLASTTTDLKNRINTAVLQIIAQAGTSEAILQLSADGYGQSAINLVAGKISLWGQNGANAIKAMEVDGDGDVLIYGKLQVASLSAITSTIGTLRTATTGARVEISDNIIQVFDANNTLRVRMGLW